MHENIDQNKIAQEFCIPVQRLQSPLNKNLLASNVQKLHLKKLAPNQDKVLHDFFCLTRQNKHIHLLAYD